MGLGDRLRRILLGRVYDEAARTASHDRGIRVVGYEKHIELMKAAEEELSKVIIPGYDYDLVSSGALKRLRLSFDMTTLYVILDYSGSDPGCNFCRFINWQVWKKILEDAESRLKGLGFSEVVFIDWSTGSVIEYRGHGVGLQAGT